MRLIDADELKKQSYESSEWDGGGFHQRVVDESDIDDAPTVDAVPYEIVKEWLEEIDKKLDNLFEKVGCNTEHIKDGEKNESERDRP